MLGKIKYALKAITSYEEMSWDLREANHTIVWNTEQAIEMQKQIDALQAEKTALEERIVCLEASLKGHKHALVEAVYENAELRTKLSA